MHRIKIVLITLACFLLPCNVQAKDLTPFERIQTTPLDKVVKNIADKEIWECSNVSLIAHKNSRKLHETVAEEIEIERPKVSEGKKIFQERRQLLKKRARLKKSLGMHPPHVIITLYPRWFFVAGGIIRGMFYYYVHFYAALFLLWSGLKMAARMDFIFNPLINYLDWAVRPLLLMSTKFLPFTGASGISAQIFLLIVSATGKFIRQFVWIIYDTEIDYLIREKRHSNLKLTQPQLPENLQFHPVTDGPDPKLITDITIKGYEKLVERTKPIISERYDVAPAIRYGRSTVSQAGYLKMEKVQSAYDDLSKNLILDPSMRWLNHIKLNVARIFNFKNLPYTYNNRTTVDKLYDGSISKESLGELWVRPDPNFAPGGKFSIFDKNLKPLIESKNLHNFDDFPFLGLYEKVPQLPRLRVLEYHEFVQYANSLAQGVIKYPEIRFWWKTQAEVGTIEWGGYIFNRALTYWPEGGGKWNTLPPGLTNWILQDGSRIDEMIYNNTYG